MNAQKEEETRARRGQRDVETRTRRCYGELLVRVERFEEDIGEVRQVAVEGTPYNEASQGRDGGGGWQRWNVALW